MKKQPERTMKTKKALKDSFWELYSQRAIEKITIREITEKAGVYRSTFYVYFPDVYAVLEEIENEIMVSYESFIQHIPEIETISEGMKLIMEFYTLNASHLAILLGPNGDSAFLHRIKKRIYSMLQNLFHIKIDDMEIDLFIELATSYVITILTYWNDHREEYTISEVIEKGSSFIQHGLVPFLQKHGINLIK